MELRRALPEKKYFKIGEVAELVGVEPHVLRYWETQFPQVRPHKARSGHRLYRRREVEALLVIRELLHVQRFTIAGARQALRQPGGWSALVPRFFDTSGTPARTAAVPEEEAGERDLEADSGGPDELTDPDGEPVGSEESILSAEALSGPSSETPYRPSYGPSSASSPTPSSALSSALSSASSSAPSMRASLDDPSSALERTFGMVGRLDHHQVALLEGALADARLILGSLDRDDARERVHP